MADIQSQMPVKITDGVNTVGITSGSGIKVDLSATTANAVAVKVDGSGVTQPVSGSVSVSNLPSTQPVSGSVSVSNFPSTQVVSGTVNTTVGETTTGVVAFQSSASAVGTGAVGTITYAVTASKTLYLKQILASSSGAPCKVVVDYGTVTPTVICTGFYSAAVPYFTVTFAQPIAITSTVNVKITNNAGVAQDCYAFIGGHEI